MHSKNASLFEHGVSVRGESDMTIKDRSMNNRLTATQWQAAVSDTFFPLETQMVEEQSFSGGLDT